MKFHPLFLFLWLKVFYYTEILGNYIVKSVLTGVISTIAKLTKTCTLRLTLDKFYFILSDKVANGGVSMWCELNQVRVQWQKY